MNLKIELRNRKYYVFVLVMTITVFLAHHFSSFLEQMVIEGDPFGWPLLFGWYYAWLFGAGILFRKVT